MNAIEDCARLLAAVPMDDMIHKLTEENGEVADCVIGIRGSNPRKGVYKTVDDLSYELLDVALTALTAWTKLHLLESDPIPALLDHAAGAAVRHRAEVGVG